MGKVYLVEKRQLSLIPRWKEMGPDALDDEVTLEVFQQRIKRHSGQIKNVLLNDTFLAGIGNAYADEILWRAKISPFKITTKLTDGEIEDLHEAIIQILNWAIDRVKNKGILEKRDFLNIHNKKKSPCPRCGEMILSVSFSNQKTFYCPSGGYLTVI